MINKVLIAVGIGAGLGFAWSAAERALVYKAWFVAKRAKSGTLVSCVKHPGMGLLMWSNGDLQCYHCGQAKYGPSDTYIINEREKAQDNRVAMMTEARYSNVIDFPDRFYFTDYHF